MKHKLISNFNMNLESIQSHLKIVEKIDCKVGVIGLTLTLKTNELEVELEISYRLKGDYELKYYRNQQMMKHILNTKLIVDQIPKEELVSLMKRDDNNKISNLSIISLAFCDVDKKLIRNFTKDQRNRLVIDRGIIKRVTESMAQNPEKTSSAEVILNANEDEDEDQQEDDDNQEEADNRKWIFLALKEDETEESSLSDNTGQPINNGTGLQTLIEKGLEMFDSKPEPKAEPQNFNDKKAIDRKKEDQKSPYTFNEGMS